MSLSVELERVRSELSPLVAAHQHLAEHAVDTEKFEKLIENLQVSKCHPSPLTLTLFFEGRGHIACEVCMRICQAIVH